MFRTVRHWWGSGRGKVTARLFAFEFVVVVAGVLTAQALANWASDRAEARAVGEEDKRIQYEIGRASQTAQLWQAAVPCLTARVEDVARKAATGAPVESAELKVPRFIGYTVEPFPPDMNRELHDRLGNDRVDNYAVVATATDSLVSSYRDVRRQWDSFALLDPALGPPSAADRTAVRNAAIQVRSQLDLIRASTGMIRTTAGRLGIPPITSDAEFGSVTPVSDCAEIWTTGRIWHERGPSH